MTAIEDGVAMSRNTKREELNMRRVVLLSVLASTAVVMVSAALAAGGYAYHHQTTHVSRLVAERADLNAQLSGSQAKLGKTAQSLDRAKKNLTTMSKDLAAAKKRADESYSSGYSSGTSAGYTSGYSEGNSSGYNNGLYDGSDSLDCSDDPDVDWLPYCS